MPAPLTAQQIALYMTKRRTGSHLLAAAGSSFKYRPDYPLWPFRSKDEACLWVAGFVDWYNHRHRHNSIRFVTPAPRHSGEAVEICRHRARVYELARQRHPRRWCRSTRFWHQPGGGLDKSTSCRPHRRSSSDGDGRLISGRGVIFSGSYRDRKTRPPQFEPTRLNC